MPHSLHRSETYPAVIIGGGQAGVATSYCLTQRGVEHLVLEGDRPFSDWHNRRWDSFGMNTPNGMNNLPGASQPFAPNAPRDAYGTLADALEYFDAYVQAVNPPIRIDEVVGVGVNRDGSWEVTTTGGTLSAHNVVICTGHASRTQTPPLADFLPASVPQLHSSQYKRPDQIDTGRVLVVGSGSSGVQICCELAASGRFAEVLLSESGNFTLPWSVLGVSTYSLMRSLGVFRITRESWLGRIMFPRLLQKGDAATPPSPRRLARTYGVRRVGRVASVDRSQIRCTDKQEVSLSDLTIVWCTGFRACYDFLDVYVRNGVLDESGRPRHCRGVVATAPGLYFVGLRFQHTFLSQDLSGVGQDAEYVAAHIAERSAPGERSLSAKTASTHVS